MGLEIVGKHDGYSPSLFGTSHSGTHLFTKHISGSSQSDPAIKPTIAPVNQTKAVNLAVIPRSLDQALPMSPLARPYAREGWVKGYLHLVLQIEVSMWHQSKQSRQVGGKLIPQISLDQLFDAERFGCCGTGQQNLYPQSFPT